MVLSAYIYKLIMFYISTFNIITGITWSNLSFQATDDTSFPELGGDMAAVVNIRSVFLLCLDLSRASEALVLRFRGLGLYELTHHEL